MPVSGLVVVFDSPESLNGQVIERLESHSAIEVGQRQHDRVAVVVDSASKQDDIEIWDWIQRLPGVSEIKIAFVGFDEDENLYDVDACQDTN